MNVAHYSTEIQCCEEWSFSIPEFEMRHDEGLYHLTIDVSYRYVAGILDGQYPDWRLIATDIKSFLSSYPSSQHYWEIVNKRLVASLIGKYKMLASLTIKISVPPLESNALHRSTTVTLVRKPLRELLTKVLMIVLPLRGVR